MNPLNDMYASLLIVTSIINFIRVFLRASIGMSFVSLAYFIHKYAVKYIPRFNEAPSLLKRIALIILGALMLGINIYLSTVNDAVDMHYIILNNVALY